MFLRLPTPSSADKRASGLARGQRGLLLSRVSSRRSGAPERSPIADRLGSRSCYARPTTPPWSWSPRSSGRRRAQYRAGKRSRLSGSAPRIAQVRAPLSVPLLLRAKTQQTWGARCWHELGAAVAYDRLQWSSSKLIYGWFTEGYDHSLLRDARALHEL